MRPYSRKLATVLVAAGACVVFSAKVALASPAYTAAAPIVTLNPREYGVDVYVPQSNNPMNCATPGWFRLKIDAQNYNGILSFILVRYASQATIEFYTASCDTVDGFSIIVAAKDHG